MKKYWKIGISILAVVVLFISMPALGTLADYISSNKKAEKEIKVEEFLEDYKTRTVASEIATGHDYGVEFIDSVKITDKEGNPIEVIKRGEEFKVIYSWSVPNEVDLYEGDYMTISVPKEASIHNSVNFPVKGTDENGKEIDEKIGEAYLDHKKNIITTIFSDFVETNKNLKGNLEFIVRLEVSKNPNDITIPLEFETREDVQVIEIKVPGEEESSNGGGESPIVEKEHILGKYGNQGQNNGQIRWTVYINERLDDMHNAVLVDELGEHQTLDPKSIGLWEGTAVRENGTLVNSRYVDYKTLEPDLRSNGFTLNFGSPGKKVYMMQYSSYIDPDLEITTSAEFYNKITLSFDDVVVGFDDAYETYVTGSGSGSGEASRNIDVTERFVDNTDLSNLAKDKVTQVEAKVNQPGRFKTETKLIDEYELISYSYKKNGKLIEADIKDGDTVELELEEDTEITYFYEKSVFAPHIYLRTKGNQLVIHYRNVDELIVYVDGHQYKTYDVLAQETDENITTPLRINSERTEVQVKGKLNGETKSEATLNSKKDNSN